MERKHICGDKREVWHRLFWSPSSALPGEHADDHRRAAYGSGERRNMFLGLEVTRGSERKTVHFLICSPVLCLFECMDLRVQQWLRGGLSSAASYPEQGQQQKNKSACQLKRGQRSPLVKRIRGHLSDNISLADRLLLFQRTEVTYKCNHEPVSEILEQS